MSLSVLNFRYLDRQDAKQLSNILLSSSSEYVKYFNPFSFDAVSMHAILSTLEHDKFIGLENKDMHLNLRKMLGFYMLRGIDEGYAEPMFGIFIAEEYAGHGLGALALQHAICVCRLAGYQRLLLKVHPDNCAAYSMYIAFGFKDLRIDNRNGNLVLCKKLLKN